MLRISVPPGCILVPLQDDAEQRRAYAAEVLDGGGRACPAARDGLAMLGADLRASGIALAGVLTSVEAGPEVSAFLTVSQWHNANAAGSDDAAGLAEIIRVRHPRAVTEVIGLPFGAAVRSVRETELSLPESAPGALDAISVVSRGVQYVLSAPAGSVVLDVSTVHLRYWGAFARQAHQIAETVRAEALRI